MIKRCSVPVLTAMAVFSAAGCGGDDGLSKQEYIAKADAICQKADEKQARVEAGKNQDRPGIYGENFSDPAFLSRYNAVTRDALKRLSALDAPEKDRKAVANLLSAIRGSIASVDKQIAALKAKDRPKQSEANKEFEQSYGDVGASSGALGLTRCQGLGN